MWVPRAPENLGMRMRTLNRLILSCLLLGVVAVPSASAHGSHGGEHSNYHSRHNRGDRHDWGKHNGNHEHQRGGQRSFLGVTASNGSCSKDTRSCDFTFSRSESTELHERLQWLLTEHLDAVESFAERICDDADHENECAGSFVAGLWNGLDATEVAIAESSCGTLHLAWSNTGLSQTWGTTNGSGCTD